MATMNWETVIIAGFVALPPTIIAIAGLIQAARTHKAVNSRMTELLEITRKQAGDEATLAEKAVTEAKKGDAAIEVVRNIAEMNKTNVDKDKNKSK